MPPESKIMSSKNRKTIADASKAERKVVKPSKRITKAAQGLRNVVAGADIDEPDGLSPETEAKLRKRLEEERRKRQAEGDEGEKTIVPGTGGGGDQELRRSVEAYDTLRKIGTISPECALAEIAAYPRKPGQGDNDHVLQYALATGRLVPIRDMRKIQALDDRGRSEHEVYLIPTPNRVIKVTHPGSYGLNLTLDAYLTRMAMQNQIAPGLDIKVVGFTLDTDSLFPQAVTDMKNIIGFHPESPDLHNALVDHLGFQVVNRASHHYIHRVTGAEIIDAHCGNFLKTPSEDYPPEEVYKMVSHPENYPAAVWRYVPIDILVEGNASKPIFAAAIRRDI